MKGKSQKGITLIALIITIVILLILAVVAIGAVNNTGIIQYAKNSVDEYNSIKSNEESIIAGYESLIESKLPEGNDDERGEINLPSNPEDPDVPEIISIAGTYGHFTNNNDANYYLFNEGTIDNGVETGTGAHIYWNSSAEAQASDEFNYIVTTDRDVIVTYSNNEQATYKLEIKKDSDGRVINKALGGRPYNYVWDSGKYAGTNVFFYKELYIENEENGFDKIETKTYPIINSKTFVNAQFDNDKMTVTKNDGSSTEYYYVAIGDIIYVCARGTKRVATAYVVLWSETEAEIIDL